MILKLIAFFLIGILSVVFCQDMKNRTMHIILPVLIFVLSLFLNYFSIELSFRVILFNIVFVFINVVGLTLYFSLKKRELFNPIDKLMGLGDVVFFIAITPLFVLHHYMLVFISGLLFSLLLHSVIRCFKKQKKIPLAGYLSLYVCAIVLFNWILEINILIFFS